VCIIVAVFHHIKINKIVCRDNPELRYIRTLAVIPPQELDVEARNRHFYNNNGLVDDPMQLHKEQAFINPWTQREKDIFLEKYVNHPKNFSRIASHLENKSTADCVLYYYLNKSSLKLKKRVRAAGLRRRRVKHMGVSSGDRGGGGNSNAGYAAGGSSAGPSEADQVFVISFIITGCKCGFFFFFFGLGRVLDGRTKSVT